MPSPQDRLRCRGPCCTSPSRPPPLTHSFIQVHLLAASCPTQTEERLGGTALQGAESRAPVTAGATPPGRGRAPRHSNAGLGLEAFCGCSQVRNQLPLSKENVLNNSGGLGSVEESWKHSQGFHLSRQLQLMQAPPDSLPCGLHLLPPSPRHHGSQFL